MKVKIQNMNGTSAIAMTAIERAHGRLMRAPDHGADGGANGGGGDAAPAGGDAGAGAAPNGGGDGAGAGAPAGGAAGNDQSGGAGDGGSTILGAVAGEAAAGEGDGQSGDASGEGGEGEGPRLTFGEGEAAAEILGAPEAYEIAVPEGMTLDSEALALVEPVLKDLNLSNAAAQAVVTAYAEKIIPLMEQRAAAQGEALGADMRREWSTAAEKQFDGKEGRPTFAEAKALSRQAFIKFGVGGNDADPFLQLLEDSGLGSHPAMLNTFAMIGRAIGEGTIEVGSGKGAPARLADRIYGQPVKPA